MQMYLRPENTYISETLARAYKLDIHVHDFFFSVGTFGGLPPPPPPYKKLATLLTIAKSQLLVAFCLCELCTAVSDQIRMSEWTIQHFVKKKKVCIDNALLLTSDMHVQSCDHVDLFDYTRKKLYRCCSRSNLAVIETRIIGVTMIRLEFD